MSEQVNKEQTNGPEQEKNIELSDQQLAEAQGGAAPPRLSDEPARRAINTEKLHLCTVDIAVNSGLETDGDLILDEKEDI
jgi:hypothetical protein